MIKIFYKCHLILLLVLSQNLLNAQDEIQRKPVNQRHFLLSTGFSSVTFRDFATSPLFYLGPGIHLGLNWENINDNREINWGLHSLFNIAIANTPESEYFPVISESFFSTFNGHFTYLRNLPVLSGDNFKIKAGGTLTGNQNLRLNPYLDNSSVGLESFFNLMTSAKADFDVSRKEGRETKILFLSIRKRPVRRTLSFQMDIGFLNFNYRPSYNYVYDDKIDGSDTNPISFVRDQYVWSMNGWRLGTKLGLTRFKSTGNGRKISYAWDVLSAPGRHATFQMATHRLEFVLLINNKR
jgi:hypothetical protein